MNVWIEDLTKAFWILNSMDVKWACCVRKVENGFIYMTAHDVRFSVADLVAEYNRQYERSKEK